MNEFMQLDRGTQIFISFIALWFLFRPTVKCYKNQMKWGKMLFYNVFVVLLGYISPVLAGTGWLILMLIYLIKK